MNTLYCIRCEKTEKTQKGNPSEFIHEVWFPFINAYGEPIPNMQDLDFCEFDMGWATCPPPEFDMDQFMETVEEPGTDDLDNLVLESVF